MMYCRAIIFEGIASIAQDARKNSQHSSCINRDRLQERDDG